MSEKKEYFKISSWKQAVIFIIAIVIIFYLFDIIDFVFGINTDAFFCGVYDKLFGK